MNKILFIFLITIKLNLFYIKNVVSLNCTKDAATFWRIAYPFIEDQYLITLVGIEDGSKQISGEIMECAQIELAIPIVYYMDPLNLKIIVDGYDEYILEYKPSDKNCYIFVCEMLACNMFRMDQGAMLNPKAKTIFLQINGHEFEIEYLVKMAWIRYQMLNVIAFLVKKPNEINNASVSELKVSTAKITVNPDVFLISMYNPFFMNQLSGLRGKVFNTYLTNFSEEHFEKDRDLAKLIVSKIDTRLENVNKYPLKIAMINFNLISEPVKDKKTKQIKYSNLDGALIQILVEQANFEPVYIELFDTVPMYGDYEPDIGFTGSLGLVERSEIDLSGNLRPIIDQNQKNSGYLSAVTEVSFWFLTPQMDLDSTESGMSFLTIFDKYSRWLLICTYLGVASFWYLLQKCFICKIKKKSKEVCNEWNFKEMLLIVFAIFIMAPQNIIFNARYERCTFAFLALFALLLSTFYQGTTVRMLATNKITNNFETLEELAKSNFKINTIKMFSNLLNTSEEDSVYGKLLKRQTIVSNVYETVMRIISERDSALMMSNRICMKVWSQLRSKKTNRPLLHILKQGPPFRSAALLLPKLSPYKDRFNNIIMQTRENGLVEFWLKKENAQMYNNGQTLFRDEENAAMFTMNELKTIFIIYLIGNAFSFLVFLGELTFCMRTK